MGKVCDKVIPSKHSYLYIVYVENIPNTFAVAVSVMLNLPSINLMNRESANPDIHSAQQLLA